MPIAFVLVDAEIDKVNNILNKIRQITAVEEAYSVAGETDIVAKVAADDFREVAKAVTEKIHKIGGIMDTTTFFAFG